jgi:hypothetical protein
LALSGAGCREKAVTYYEVPHEEPAALPKAAMDETPRSPGSPPATARPAGPQLEWDKPSGWTDQPPAQMRLASYAFTAADDAKADISVTAFPDAAGGLLANLNRWRGQVGLPPVGEADIATTAQSTTIAGQAAWLVDFAGTPKDATATTRIVGAIVPVSGTSWFFKMIGPDAVVISQREAFGQMIASVRAVTPMPATMAGDAPAGDPHAGIDMSAAARGSMPGMEGGAAAVPPPPVAAGFTFTAPAGWQQQAPTQFRVVNFIVPGPGVPAAEFYVAPLTGKAGGELANLNRWRNQLQLPPVAASDLPGMTTSVTGPAGTFKIFDLASTGPALKTGQRARMLAAVLERGETSWFFRLTGEIEHVDAQREAFTAFLQSCRFEAP